MVLSQYHHIFYHEILFHYLLGSFTGKSYTLVLLTFSKAIKLLKTLCLLSVTLRSFCKRVYSSKKTLAFPKKADTKIKVKTVW